jgi:hypothetical protein
LNIEAHAPANNEAVVFATQTQKLRMQLPQDVVPTSLKNINLQRGEFGSGAAGAGRDSVSKVCALHGTMQAIAFDPSMGGTTLLKLQAPRAEEKPVADTDGVDEHDAEGAKTGADAATNEPAAAVAVAVAVATASHADSVDAGLGLGLDDASSAALHKSAVGVVSVGDVSLGTLKTSLEHSGVDVEFRITDSGGVLLCGNQVTLQKEGDTDSEFVVEGPFTLSYWKANEVLYQQFAVI